MSAEPTPDSAPRPADSGATIRPAVREDAEILADLIRRSFRDVADRFGLTPENCPRHPSNCAPEWILRDLDRGVAFFLLEGAGIPAGCAGLELPGEGMAYLERLSVAPEHRRRGLGRRLADHVVARAVAAGASRMSIGIVADQHELADWYRRMGFADGPVREFPHLPFRVRFMTKGLSASDSDAPDVSNGRDHGGI